MLRADPVFLSRTGDAPLRLDGPSLAASASSQRKNDTRWHQIDIWEAESLGLDRYVVAIAYRTCWQGEYDWHDAWVIERAALRDTLRGYDPVAHVRGYPPGAQYEERQRRMIADLRDRWPHAVSEVLQTMSVWELAGGDRPQVEAETGE